MKKKNPDKRAKELHEKIKDSRKKRSVTTAVRNTETEISIVGTSDRYLRKEIREALNENELEAKSILGNHAEQNVLAEAEKRNLTIVEIGASRPICLDCEEELKEKGIFSWSPFSGKKSRNRKNKTK